ncbi:MAG: hypothetical protein WDM91_15775 [Rhizomicrobium sp.]
MPSLWSKLTRIVKRNAGRKRNAPARESREDAHHRRRKEIIGFVLLGAVIVVSLVLIVVPGVSNEQFNWADRIISGVTGGVIGFLSGRRPG